MDVEFFEEHAGFNYDPATETPEQGRHRCAVELATSEKWAEQARVRFEWFEDWAVGSHVSEFDAYDDEPTTCEMCVATLGAITTSLGCIDDATDEYRRVIEAELASEIRHDVERGVLVYA